MISKRMGTVMGVGMAVVLAGLIAVTSTDAKTKPCPKLCKNEIKACRVTECTTKPKGKCKRKCKKDIVAACHQSGGVACFIGSTSGAFLE